MSRNIQEYINSLVNKQRVYYLDLNNLFQKQGYQCSTCHQNLQNNPISAKNLNNLTNEQFAKLVNGIKDQKIRINSFKGTLLIDLLTYAQQLTTSGNNQQKQNAQYLQTLIQHSPVKTNDNQPNNNIPLLISGIIILVVIFALGIGYLWGKKKQQTLDYE